MLPLRHWPLQMSVGDFASKPDQEDWPFICTRRTEYLIGHNACDSKIGRYTSTTYCLAQPVSKERGHRLTSVTVLGQGLPFRVKVVAARPVQILRVVLNM